MPRETKKPLTSRPAFPWRCRKCGEHRVELSRVDYDAQVRHDGRLYSFVVPDLEIPVCQACDATIFTETVDEQINAGLRKHLGLLSPAQIREGLQRIGASQKKMAQQLEIAEATLSRWLNETQIQSRSLDTLMQIYFAFPAVRTALADEGRFSLTQQ